MLPLFELTKYAAHADVIDPASNIKSELGQFMTPRPIAEFMTALFDPPPRADCRLLDAGAGEGALSLAFLDRWIQRRQHPACIDIDAFEVDDVLRRELNHGFAPYRHVVGVKANVVAEDFILGGVQRVLAGATPYSHAILNPPYKKMSSDSQHRKWLRLAGIETVNLYSAFVALALALLKPHGQLAAIIPRSFCNGPYYRPFRDFMFRQAAIRRIHLFSKRNAAFKDDGVLQENVIIVLEKGSPQGSVTISTSTDATFSDLSIFEMPFCEIVLGRDEQKCIHIPMSKADRGVLRPSLTMSLAELNIEVSTGPVVDFRLRQHLKQMPEAQSVPLLYPGHFETNRSAVWPKIDYKKPNAIALNDDTKKWLYPVGWYVVVRRFSSKEEPRRIVAHVVDPSAFPEAQFLGFENHLNVFHARKRGISDVLATGLATFLNSDMVDEYFRRFNGHTQVNATDLKLLRYPDRELLTALGEWALTHASASPAEAEEAVGEFIR